MCMSMCSTISLVKIIIIKSSAVHTVHCIEIHFQVHLLRHKSLKNQHWVENIWTSLLE